MNDLPKLLRAIANGSDAKESKHGIILNAAADELEKLRSAIVELSNSHRHRFSEAVEKAADDLFRQCSYNRIIGRIK